MPYGRSAKLALPEAPVPYGRSSRLALTEAPVPHDRKAHAVGFVVVDADALRVDRRSRRCEGGARRRRPACETSSVIDSDSLRYVCASGFLLPPAKSRWYRPAKTMARTRESRQYQAQHGGALRPTRAMLLCLVCFV